MRQLHRAPDFGEKAIDAQRSETVLAQDLDRDAAAADTIARPVDNGRSASAQLTLDGVSLRDIACQVCRSFRTASPAGSCLI
jgi:hypothetical protein